MRELRTAGVVGDFDLLQAIPHFDAHGLEARLHQHLAPRKVDREWFRVSTDWALVLLDRQAKDDRELRAQLLDS